MKILEVYKDFYKEVVRVVEEVVFILVSFIYLEQCIKVFCFIIQIVDYFINFVVIKMQIKVVERIVKELLLQFFVDIILGLLQGYDNIESSVCKVSVFCLVVIYFVIGEDLKFYFVQFIGSKMKLLNLYIKRVQIINSNSSFFFDVFMYS